MGGFFINFFLSVRADLQLLKMQKEFTANDVTLDTLPSLESIKELQTEYTNMLTAIIDLLDGAKYLWEGDQHE